MENSEPQWLDMSGHPTFQTVTRIRFPNVEGHATGFFYNSRGTTYLVTNRHVLIGEEYDNPESIRIFTREVDSINNREFHDIELSEGEGDDWFSHPQGEVVDIAVIPLEFNLDSINPRIGIDDERPPKTGSLAFNSDSILSEKDRVLPGDRCQIVGYPGQYVDQVYDFPVVRNAIVSTQYGLPYNQMPQFLTDARMHPGTSGSPVLAGPVTLITHGGIDLWGPAYKLLGVHSATLQQSTAPEDSPWLDLNTAWYAELIDETLQSVEGDNPGDDESDR